MFLGPQTLSQVQKLKAFLVFGGNVNAQPPISSVFPDPERSRPSKSSILFLCSAIVLVRTCQFPLCFWAMSALALVETPDFRVIDDSGRACQPLQISYAW